jgi:hypothetical protein
MTREDIMSMAQKASKYAEQTVNYYNGKFDGLTWEQRLNIVKYEKFAALVAAHEREQCALVAEELRPSKPEYDQRFYDCCTFTAMAIRARNEK